MLASDTNTIITNHSGFFLNNLLSKLENVALPMEADIHPNPTFRTDDSELNLTFARERGFGVLSVNADPTPIFAHVPFHLSENGTNLDLHLVRSNPIANNGLAKQPAVIVVSGPDSYVSPDWYKLDDQVPTWNYTAVHLHGTLERLPEQELGASLDVLSDQYESRLAPKPIWKADKLPADVMKRMMRMIVPFRFTITRTEGTWKLGQNKPDPARQSAAEFVHKDGIGLDVETVSKLMMHPPKR